MTDGVTVNDGVFVGVIVNDGVVVGVGVLVGGIQPWVLDGVTLKLGVGVHDGDGNIGGKYGGSFGSGSGSPGLNPGGGSGSFIPGASSSEMHPPLIKNPFCLVTVKSKFKSTVA